MLTTTILLLAFFRYFYEQNKLVRNGDIEGVELELKTLGIGNGIIDAEIQFPFVSCLSLAFCLSNRCQCNPSLFDMGRGFF